MSLKLMYITADPAMGRMAMEAGVDRLFVDLEWISKADRQRGRNTVINHHTVADVAVMRACMDAAASGSELVVRCNPWHEASGVYSASREEINAVVAAGADAVMLPYFKHAAEVECFLDTVAGRARTVLLLETPEAVSSMEEILSLGGIDEVHLGLNDLSIGYGRRFLFELLADGTVEMLCRRLGEAGLPYGFGGVAAIGEGILPAEYVVAEHYRLGSGAVILSRSFGGAEGFAARVRRLRAWEAICVGREPTFYARNAARVRAIVAGVCGWGASGEVLPRECVV